MGLPASALSAGFSSFFVSCLDLSSVLQEAGFAPKPRCFCCRWFPAAGQQNPSRGQAWSAALPGEEEGLGCAFRLLPCAVLNLNVSKAAESMQVSIAGLGE